MVHHKDEQIGIIEKVVYCGKWVEFFIDGKESSMKDGELSYLVYQLPDLIWGDRYHSEVAEIVKIIPDWPVGARVKHTHLNIAGIWIPTRKVWLRYK